MIKTEILDLVTEISTLLDKGIEVPEYLYTRLFILNKQEIYDCTNNVTVSKPFDKPSSLYNHTEQKDRDF